MTKGIVFDSVLFSIYVNDISDPLLRLSEARYEKNCLCRMRNKSFSYQDTPPLRSLLVCILNFDNKTSKIFSKCNHLFRRYLGETHFVHKSRAVTRFKNKEKQNVNHIYIYVNAYANFY